MPIPPLSSVDPLSANPAPAARERVAELVSAMGRVHQLQGLGREELEWLARHGTEIHAEAGEILFRPGDAADHMIILLRGEIHVRRDQHGPVSFFIGRSGQITGVLPYSRMKTYGGIGFVVADAWGLQYHRSIFPEMLQAIPSMAERAVMVLLDRVREATRIEQQAEKLSALGKLAANLAHELNNPASAARRAASGMLHELGVFRRERLKLGQLGMPDDQIQRIEDWENSMRSKSAEAQKEGATARENAILAWLERNRIQDLRLAPELAECGIGPEDLDNLRRSLDATAAAAGAILSQFTSSLRAERNAEAMLNSTARIFDLIRAIKDYSYMDQAPIQEIDIPQGLENTLAMMASRLQNVEIIRSYEPDLPTISAYGSELNQVWTALIENALDAIEDRGRIQLTVRLSGDSILTEITDDGPGIPAENQARVLEPFFSTKSAGFGIGLGLDTVNRIVRIHRGFVSLDSRPGRTCFQVRLPIQQLQAY